jgi:hypothetical protein
LALGRVDRVVPGSERRPPRSAPIVARLALEDEGLLKTTEVTAFDK